MVKAERLWRRWKRTRDTAVREELIAACIPIVCTVVKRSGGRFSLHCTFDELISYGYDGLLSAIDTYDPTAGASFDRWIKQRVEWAIADALRLMERWVPRSVWLQDREMQHVESALRNKLHRSPTREEMLETLGWTNERYETQLIDIHRSTITALDEPFYFDDDPDTRTLLDVLENPSSPNPEQLYIRLESYNNGQLSSALLQLTTTERIIIQCYFGLRFTQVEIGGLLHITPSRVSQLLGGALARLRLTLIEPEPRKKAYEYRSAVS